MTNVIVVLACVLFLACAVVTAVATYCGRQPYRLDDELDHMHRADAP